MRIKFWGTRGSIPVSGPGKLKYGGNTPCVEIRTDDGRIIIIDCGSGIRELGYQLMEEGFKHGGREAVILLSHCHWDHIQGLPFFKPAYIRGNHFSIYGLRSFIYSLESALVGQMQRPYFPNNFFEVGADFTIREIPECRFWLDKDIQITTAYMNHPDETFGFRIDYNGKSFVYASDNEHIPSEPDEKVINFAKNADILVHDAQFSLEEYFENKVGWGHSVPEVAVQTARLSKVKKLLLFHYDPAHDDAYIDQMVEHCQDLNRDNAYLTIEGARDYQVIEL